MGDNSFELVGQREATRPGSGWLSQSSALVLVVLSSSICHTLYFIAFPLGITLDSPFYINGAYHLLSDNLLLNYPVRTPGYQIIVAALLFISGGKVVAVSLFQHLSLILLGVLVTWRLYPFGRPKLALLCGLLIGANPALGLLSSFILSETIFLFIVTSVLLVESLPSIRSRLSPLFRYAVIGVGLGFATLVRFNGALVAAVVIVVPLVMALLLQSNCKWERARHSFYRSAIITLWYILVLSPWLALRFSEFGELSVVAKHSGHYRLEMLIATNLIDPSKIDDRELRDAYVLSLRTWDSLPSKAKGAGGSFYYLVGPQLESKFGATRVGMVFDRYWRDRVLETPTWFLKELSILLAYNLGVLPYSMGIGGLFSNSPLDQIIVLSNGNPVWRATAVEQIADPSIRAEIREWRDGGGLIVSVAPYLLELSRWIMASLVLIVAYSCIALARSDKLYRVLNNIPLMVFFANALLFAWHLKVEERYVVIGFPLLVLGMALLLVDDGVELEKSR